MDPSRLYELVMRVNAGALALGHQVMAGDERAAADAEALAALLEQRPLLSTARSYPDPGQRPGRATGHRITHRTTHRKVGNTVREAQWMS